MNTFLSPAQWYAVPNIYGFLERFTDFLQQIFQEDPICSQQTLIILPTRRSCNHLKEMLMKRSNGQAFVFPSMATFTDLTTVPCLRPHLPRLKKDESLARLVHLLMPLLPQPTTLTAVLHHAQMLQGLIEEWSQHRLSLKDLQRVVPHHLAEHLQANLALFCLAFEHLSPTDLKVYQQQTGYQAVLNNKYIQRLILVTASPPDPVTLEFIVSCQERPQTDIFLLGLDPYFYREKHPKAEPYHPQYAFLNLLEKAQLTFDKLKLFPEKEMINSRHQLCLRLFAQDQLLLDEEIATNLSHSLENVSLVECHSQHEEASAIAVILREAINSPDLRAALITPDRQLANLVKAQLRRWNLDIDDSAGELFFETPVGAFLKLVAECIATNFAPISLLSFLKHPYCALHRLPAQTRRLARLLERSLLRRHEVSAQNLSLWREKTDNEELKELLGALESESQIFRDLFQQPLVSVKELLKIHIELAKCWATSPEIEGERSLFKGEIGESIFKILQDLLKTVEHFPLISPKDYVGVFVQLLHGQRVRKTYGYHPRLFILEPMQAQLQTFDWVVLGGLNTGTWPQDTLNDPLFSQDMRQACGLPTINHKMGAEVQHFIYLLTMPHVVMTRSCKVNGGLTLPSPWLQRLQTALKACQAEDLLKPKREWVTWAKYLDQSSTSSSVDRPRPQPPLHIRPRELSVTDIDKLLMDPYAFYAHKILTLKETPPLVTEPTASLFGNIVHQAMKEFFCHATPSLDCLLKIGQQLFFPLQQMYPVFHGLYWPKYTLIAEWIYEQYCLEKENIAQTFTEVYGSYEWMAPGGPVRLIAVADRIDVLNDGSLRIIDYKTGVLPSLNQIREGLNPQLALEAIIAEKGQFKGLDMLHRKVSALEFWQLGRHLDGGERLNIDKELDAYIQDTHLRLERLLTFYDQPEAVYQAAWKARPFCPYSQLARRYEWSIAS